MSLSPCPVCQRHIQTTEATCPFCRASVAPFELAAWPTVRGAPAPRRLGRYAAFTVRTGRWLAGSGLVVVVVGCSPGELIPGGSGGGSSAGGAPGAGGSAAGGSGTGGSLASGGVPGSGGTIQLGGLGGFDDGGAPGSGGEDFGVPIYSAVPFPKKAPE